MKIDPDPDNTMELSEYIEALRNQKDITTAETLQAIRAELIETNTHLSAIAEALVRILCSMPRI